MKFVLFAFVLICASSFAAEVSFECKFSDLKYINQFSLEMRGLTSDQGQFSNASFDLSLRKRGTDSPTDRLSVTRDGKVEFFEAGTFGTKKSVRISSTLPGDEIEYINILVGVAPKHSSQVRTGDGRTYFGSCKFL
jgi:hypothetical protein